MNDYYGWAAGRKRPTLAQVVEPAAVPAKDDPLATSMRVALDARKLGWDAERTHTAMVERGGAGIEVQEHCLPDTVRRPVMTLEEMAAREAKEEAALLLAKAAR